MGWKEIMLDKDYLEGKEKPAIEPPARVVITGVNINFFSLVLFLARLMLAALPALILAGLTMGALWMFLAPLLLPR